MTLSERIKYARIARGITQEQFGERLGRTRVAVHYWENGKNTPSLLMLEQISQLLNVEMRWLLLGQGSIPKFITRAATKVLLDQSPVAVRLGLIHFCGCSPLLIPLANSSTVS